MKRILCVAILAALTGCQSVEQLRASVGNASNFQLCRAIFLAPNNVAQIAREEAQRRSLECEPYASAVFQSEAQADAARNALAQQLLAPAPMPQPARPRSCTTRVVGNVAHTDCW